MIKLYTLFVNCTALHCTVLHCFALHCTVLHCTTLYCTGVKDVVKHKICTLLFLLANFILHMWSYVHMNKLSEMYTNDTFSYLRKNMIFLDKIITRFELFKFCKPTNTECNLYGSLSSS